MCVGGNLNTLRRAGNLKLEVQHRRTAGGYDDAFGNIAKTWLGDVDRIFAYGDGVELKLAALVGLHRL